MAAGAARAGVGESGYSRQTTAAAVAQPEEFDSEAADSTDEIAMVRRATEVLGVNHIAHWMASRIPSLDNQTPYALLKTPEGRSQVQLVLLKIEHGVY